MALVRNNACRRNKENREAIAMLKKILIVDDSAALQELQAMDTIDLVITDVNMPNMDGITLIGKVRAIAKFKFTPILVLTTDSQGSKMNEGKEIDCMRDRIPHRML
jgi:PleD family two-component response regulator